MNLTEEQAQVATYPGQRLVVKAYAGTGKTSTLIQYALNNPHDRILYLAYNRAIRDEACGKFPANVDCKTSHQLAFHACGKNLANKLSANLRLKDIAHAANSNNWTFARDVFDTINQFVASDAPAISAKHFTRLDDTLNTSSKVARYQIEVLDWAEKIWERMISPNDSFPATHDTYLKLYQQGRPQLHHRYSTILFDEAQDANPVTSAIVLSQPCKLILVGDEHQQIYRFRGASNALNHPALKDADKRYLTHSFRFGPKVAFIANALLELKGETRPVYGNGGPDQLIKPQEHFLGEKHTALINRTVMGVIADAIQCATHGLKTYWVGGSDAYALNDLMDVYFLSNGQVERIRNPRFKNEYRDYSDYIAMAEVSKDLEMLRTIKIIETYGDIPACIALIRKFEVKDEMEAIVTLTTAHRSKGLEWDDVRLGEDFPDFLSSDMDEDEKTDEINLLYVASTRAMQRLILSSAIEPVLRHVISIRKAAKAQPQTNY